MFKKFRTMREERADGGFTLIELLVVVVIIGILVSIAIPVYLNYRKGAANKTAQSDVRSAVTAIEEFYTENAAYPGTAQTAGPLAAGAQITFAAPAGGTAQVTNISPNNALNYRYTAASSSYTVCARNSDGQTVYFYNSLNSRSVAKSAYQGANNSLAQCSTNGR